MELWDYMEISCLIFCKIVFQSSCTILHSTSNTEGFLSPTITNIIVFLNYVIIVGYKVLSHCGLDDTSLKTNDVQHYFMCLLDICIFLWRNVYLSSSYTVCYCLRLLRYKMSLYVLDIRTRYIYKYFLLFCGLSLWSLDNVFKCTNSIYLFHL